MGAVSATGRLGIVSTLKTGRLSQLVASRKGKTILVRWLAIIATSYFLFLNLGSGGDLAIEFLIGFYITTNVVNAFLGILESVWDDIRTRSKLRSKVDSGPPSPLLQPTRSS